MTFLDRLRTEPKSKIIIAAIIILGLLYVLLYNPYDKDYLEAVEKEIPLAQALCESSVDWVLNNSDSLKLDNNTLDHIRVDGELVKLKHIKYPKAILLHDGFLHPGAQVEFFCTFREPRAYGEQSYFYDYRRRIWVDKTIARR